MTSYKVASDKIRQFCGDFISWFSPATKPLPQKLTNLINCLTSVLQLNRILCLVFN